MKAMKSAISIDVPGVGASTVDQCLKRQIRPRKQRVEAMVETLMPVMGEEEIAERHQQVAIAAQPGRIAAVEVDDELRHLFRRQVRRPIDLPVELPQRLRVGCRTVAVRIEADQADRQRQLYGGIVDLRQGSLRNGEVIGELPDHGAGLIVGQRLGIGIVGHGQPEERH
jgi:hypothetical protein